MSNICTKAAEIKEQIINCSSESVNIVIASKYANSNQLNELVSCGHNVFGENKVQDLLAKSEEVEEASWHFIGHLQTNKVKYIIGLVELIHSVDSYRLASKINKEAAKKNICQDILIQVNIAEEDTKYGVRAGEIDELVDEILKFSNIRLRGLMAIMPYADKEGIRSYYKSLKNMFDNLKIKVGDQIEILSAGMSNDWRVALEEGSNLLRIGSAIFGG